MSLTTEQCALLQREARVLAQITRLARAQAADPAAAYVVCGLLEDAGERIEALAHTLDRLAADADARARQAPQAAPVAVRAWRPAR